MLGSEGFKLDERRDYDYSRDLELEKMVEKLTNRSLSFKYLEPSIQVLPAVRDKESLWCRPLSGRRRAGPQFCSQCISEFPYLGPLSRLTCSMVCLKHSVFLTDSCSACKKIAFLYYGVGCSPPIARPSPHFGCAGGAVRTYASRRNRLLLRPIVSCSPKSTAASGSFTRPRRRNRRSSGHWSYSL